MQPAVQVAVKGERKCGARHGLCRSQICIALRIGGCDDDVHSAESLILKSSEGRQRHGRQSLGTKLERSFQIAEKLTSKIDLNVYISSGLAMPYI